MVVVDLVFPIAVTLRGMVWAVTAGEYLRVQAGLDYSLVCLVLVMRLELGFRSLRKSVSVLHSPKGQ